MITASGSPISCPGLIHLRLIVCSPSNGSKSEKLLIDGSLIIAILISALISEEYFEWLDGPIKRVAAKDCPVPYNWYLEEEVLPQTEDISVAIKELLEY